MDIMRYILLLIVVALAASAASAEEMAWTPCLLGSTSSDEGRSKTEEICAHELAKERLSPSSKKTEYNLLSRYALLVEAKGDYAEAETLRREALAMSESFGDTKSYFGSNADIMANISMILSLMAKQEKYVEALPLLHRLKAIASTTSAGALESYKGRFRQYAIAFLERGMESEAHTLIEDPNELQGLRKRMVQPLTPDIGVISAEFGVFNPFRSKTNSFFEPTVNVPYVPDRTTYGWRIGLRTKRGTVRWRQELLLPSKPINWQTDLPHRISQDGRMITTEVESPLGAGQWLYGDWRIAKGDPKGRYVMKVYVEDVLVRKWDFDVE